MRSLPWAALAALFLVLLLAARVDSTSARQTTAADEVNAAPGGFTSDVLDASSIIWNEAPAPALVSSAAADAKAPAAAVTDPVAETPAAAAPAEPAAPAVVAPVVRAAPIERAAPVAPPPATCPVNSFCYPRVGIAGPIVPYTDCTGSTDVGLAIRSLSCVSSTYLAAHAYTQFGRIAGWRTGDIVFAYGTRYVIVGAFTQGGCEAPARAIAPLSLQTSLTPATCGPILVVQGRPG